jgi:hypothetical protein
MQEEADEARCQDTDHRRIAQYEQLLEVVSHRAALDLAGDPPRGRSEFTQAQPKIYVRVNLRADPAGNQNVDEVVEAPLLDPCLRNKTVELQAAVWMALKCANNPVNHLGERVLPGRHPRLQTQKCHLIVM